MALILNIETSTTNCSVALSEDSRLLKLREQNEGYTHAENITLFIAEVFEGSAYSIGDLDAVAVSEGPGSYTGLRIGVSAAKGIAYTLDIPLIGVNTLQSMTALVLQSENSAVDLFCPMIDARRMEVYSAFFDSSLNQLGNISAVIVDENSFAETLSKKKILFFGDGASKCKSAVTGENAFFLDGVFPSAKGMINISERKFIEEKFEDVAYFEPYYLKNFLPGKGSVTG